MAMTAMVVSAMVRAAPRRDVAILATPQHLIAKGGRRGSVGRC
jgi:hypothetical protein